MTDCRSTGRDNPRLLNGHHYDTDVVDEHGHTIHTGDDCRGCIPCEQGHCAICGTEHLTDAHPHTCIECVSKVRDDLVAIPDLCSQVRRHAQSGNAGRLAAAPIPGGEAMVIMSPAGEAHSRAYYEEGHRKACTNPACTGCLDASHKQDEYRDAVDTPTLVLARWEDVWRTALDSPADHNASIRRATSWLGDHLTMMAQRVDPPVDEFSHDLAQLRYHLEEVLGDGVRNQPGAPCLNCGTALVRISSKPRACKHRRLAADVARLAHEPRFDLASLCRAYPTVADAHSRCDQGGLRDTWQCLRCRRRYSDDQYQYAVGSEYISKARSLTARELEFKTGVPASVVRVWGSRGLVKKVSRDEFGIWRYDVAQVEKQVPLWEQRVREAAARAELRAAKERARRAGAKAG